MVTNSDNEGESRWLTYEALGIALNIAPASAKRLALRRKWAKRIGNEGKTLVCVPADRLPLKQAVTGDNDSDSHRDDTVSATGDTVAIVTALNAHIETLKKQIEKLEAERNAERTRADTEAEKATEATVKSATIEPLKETIALLKTALANEKHRSAELSQERNHWRETAIAPRGFLRWFR